jgi:flagellar hook-length control protein FliK
MRVRLKPDHLGELQVRVVASGNRIGLSIQASDESAKKVIEESLGHLRENLAVQNLSLASVDVSVGQSSASRESGQQQQQQNGQNLSQQFQQDLMGQGSGRDFSGGQNGRGETGSSREDGFSPVRTAARTAQPSGSSALSAAGRLDVRA